MGSTILRYGIPALVLGGLFIVVYTLMTATSASQGSSGLKGLAQGEMKDLMFLADTPPMAPSEFYGPDGETTTLAAIADLPGAEAGKLLVVNIWATHCAPCVYEMPTLAKLQALRGSDTFEVIAISVDRTGDRDFARSELAKLTDNSLTFYHDPPYSVMFDVGGRGMPTTLIYNAAGEEVARYEGDTDWASEEALAFLDAVAAGETP